MPSSVSSVCHCSLSNVSTHITNYNHITMKQFLSLIAIAATLSACQQAPEEGITIRPKDQGFVLRINGQDTYVKGVGGTFRLEDASANGANAFRTWGGRVESIKADCEKAAANHMLIMQGIGMTQDSLKYYDPEYRQHCLDNARELAEAFKDDPNILAWGIGNEINLGNANIGVAWQLVEEMAQIIKSIDHRHLVSTVISHSREALDSVACYCPTLDYVGINSYGDIKSLEQMVNESDYKGPFMVTEWGPTGWWETATTEWGAWIEQTSEEKRQVYEQRYNDYILANPRCLGSFVFLWGQKEERTPTWFSMFSETEVEGLPLKGEKTPMVEAMQRVWTGQELTQTAPVIEEHVKLNDQFAYANIRVDKGEPITGSVKVTDREGDALTFVWEVLQEATVLGFGGSYEPRPDRVGEVITTNEPLVTLNAPAKPGNYRLYVYVLDGTGFVSTDNVAFQVK